MGQQGQFGQLEDGVGRPVEAKPLGYTSRLLFDLQLLLGLGLHFVLLPCSFVGAFVDSVLFHSPSAWDIPPTSGTTHLSSKSGTITFWPAKRFPYGRKQGPHPLDDLPEGRFHWGRPSV